MVYLAAAGCYIFLDIGDNGIKKKLSLDPSYAGDAFVENHLAVWRHCVAILL